MIAYGVSVTMPDVHASAAGRGIARVAEPGDATFVLAAVASIARTYNIILDLAAARDDLEALVLLHQDLELADGSLPGAVRAALAADPDVALLGVAGAGGPAGAGDAPTMASWEGTRAWSSVTLRYGELGGGAVQVPIHEAPGHPVERAPGRVDTVAGPVLVLSPWAVRELRFDEGLPARYGYDLDLGRQVRAAGRTAAVLDVPVLHHHTLDLVVEPSEWAAAHARVAAKWDGGDEDRDSDAWRARARRAEADAAAARLLVASMKLRVDAEVLVHQAEMRTMTESLSWRLTRPLRRSRARREGRPLED